MTGNPHSPGAPTTRPQAGSGYLPNSPTQASPNGFLNRDRQSIQVACGRPTIRRPRGGNHHLHRQRGRVTGIRTVQAKNHIAAVRDLKYAALVPRCLRQPLTLKTRAVEPVPEPLPFAVCGSSNDSAIASRSIQPAAGHKPHAAQQAVFLVFHPLRCRLTVIEQQSRILCDLHICA